MYTHSHMYTSIIYILYTHTYTSSHSTHTHSNTLKYTQLIDIVKRFETLQNVLLSVTKNIQSILLTAVLAIILIYLYSILGYMFFSNDFMIATNPMEHFTELRKMGECDAGRDGRGNFSSRFNFYRFGDILN